MNLEIFKNMDKKQLKRYIESLLYQYRVADGFWFIYVSEHFGQETAEQINEEVWKKVSGIAAKDIISRFKIKEKGLDRLVKATRLFPWCIICDYKIERKEDHVVLTVPDCPPQQARIKRGLGEYVCKYMHESEFKGFAKIIDPKIEVECVFAPPDPHPEDLFCKWRFYIKQ